MADVQGRCVSCGFLSWRVHNLDTSPFYEVKPGDRESGERPDARFHHSPKCFKGVVGPGEVCETLKSKGVAKAEAFKTAIALPLACERYFPYTPGQSPKEHDVMHEAAEVARLATESHQKDMDRAERLQDKTFDRQDKALDREDAREEKARVFQKEMMTLQQEFQLKITGIQQGFQKDTTDSQQKFQRELTEKQARRENIRWAVSALGTVVVSVATFLAGRGCFAVPSPATATPTTLSTPTITTPTTEKK